MRFFVLIFCLVCAVAHAEEPAGFFGHVHKMPSSELRNSPQVIQRLRNTPPSPLRLWTLAPHFESQPAVDPAQDPLLPLLMEDLLAAEIYPDKEQLTAAFGVVQERRSKHQTVYGQSREAMTNGFRVKVWRNLVARYPNEETLHDALTRFFSDGRLTDHQAKEYARELWEAQQANEPASWLPKLGMEAMVPVLETARRPFAAMELRRMIPKADLPKSRLDQMIGGCRQYKSLIAIMGAGTAYLGPQFYKVMKDEPTLKWKGVSPDSPDEAHPKYPPSPSPVQ